MRLQKYFQKNSENATDFSLTNIPKDLPKGLYAEHVEINVLKSPTTLPIDIKELTIKMKSILSNMKSISGINIPMLYFGLAGSVFTIHKENCDFAALSVLLKGKIHVLCFGFGCFIQKKRNRRF